MQEVPKVFGLVAVAVAVLFSSSLFAREHVYVCPLKLTAADNLTDGPQVNPIKV